MSLSRPNIILGRIEIASEESPIAVLTPNIKGETLDAFFFATASGQTYIQQNEHKLIGIFDNTMNPKEVKNILLTAVKKNKKPNYEKSKTKAKAKTKAKK